MKFDTTSKAGLYIFFINVILGVFLFTSLENSDTAFLLTLISSFIGIYLNIHYFRTNIYNRNINAYALVLNVIAVSAFMIIKIYMNQYL